MINMEASQNMFEEPSNEQPETVDYYEAIKAENPNITDKEMINLLVEGLMFYADPDSYFAIAMLPDPPAGAFAEDWSEISLVNENNEVVDTEVRPGKFARETLARVVGHELST